MISRTVVLNDIEPGDLSLRHPFGVDLDLAIAFRDQHDAPVDPAPIWPQLALLPRSRGGVYAYDIETTSSAGGTAQVSIPGAALTDRSGYGLELYLRAANAVPGDPPLPVGLAAQGVLRLQGSAYQRYGPLAPISVPVVTGPTGPQGPQGEASTVPGPTGQRGSVWTTGPGDPVVMGGELPGDMFLDETTGNVWQFDTATGWARRTFP